MVAVSRLEWLVGGDDRRMLIDVGIVVAGVCRTVGSAVLFALRIGCWGEFGTFGILFNSEGFWRAKVLRRAAMLAGLEM